MDETKRRVLVDEDDENTGKGTTRVSNFDTKNYLNVKLADNEDQKELKIRLLPFDSTATTPFKKIYMHTIRVPKEISQNEWKSYVCLRRTEDIDHEVLGNKCPFCEKNHDAYEKKVECDNIKDEVNAKRWKDISIANAPKEVCVVRCIERGAESDGPKFWKFNLRSDKDDVMWKIKDLAKSREKESIDIAKDENNGVLPEGFVPDNILDLYEGKDLIVTIKAVYDTNGKRTNKTTISIRDYGNKKPVTTDEALLDKWIDDPKKWSDVFVAKPYEYLAIILDGKMPFFDKEKGIWRPKDEKDNEKEENKKKSNAAAAELDKQIKENLNQTTPQAPTKPDNDDEALPF